MWNFFDSVLNVLRKKWFQSVTFWLYRRPNDIDAIQANIENRHIQMQQRLCLVHGLFVLIIGINILYVRAICFRFFINFSFIAFVIFFPSFRFTVMNLDAPKWTKKLCKCHCSDIYCVNRAKRTLISFIRSFRIESSNCEHRKAIVWYSL